MHAIKGELEQAEVYFKKAHSIDPNDKIVNGNLKRLEELKQSSTK